MNNNTISIQQLGHAYNNILLAFSQQPDDEQGKEYSEAEICENLYQGIMPWDPPINFDLEGPFTWVDVCWRKANRVALVWNAFTQVHQSYHKHLTALDSHLIKYQNYLCNKYKQLETSEREIKDSVENILHFHHHCSYFFQIAKQMKHQKLTSLFQKNVFCRDCFRSLNMLESYYAEINLRARIANPIPYDLIKRISLGGGGEQDERWKTFVEHCASSGIQSDELHRGLGSILLHCFENHMDAHDLSQKKLPCLPLVELAIEDTKTYLDRLTGRPKPPLLTQVSLTHILWRNTLSRGSLIKSTSIKEHPSLRDHYIMQIHEITLGNQIGRKESREIDHNVFFEIHSYFISERSIERGQQTLEDYLEIPEENSRKPREDLASRNLVLISINEALAGMKGAKTPVFLGNPKFEYIDSMGRFAIVEKLGDPLGGEIWREKVKKDEVEREYYISIIAYFVEVCLEKNQMPSRLNVNYLMQPDEGDLKSVKPVSMQFLDFVALEKFIYDASFKDPEIFKLIMEKANFIDHQSAKILREAVLSAFIKDPFDIKYRVSSDLQAEDVALINCAENMRIKIKQLHSHICEKLGYEENELRESEKETVASLLLEKYQSSGACTFLWPTLSDEVIAEYKISLNSL